MTAPSPESLALPEPALFAPQMITEDAYTAAQMFEFARAERLRVIEECEAIAQKYLIPRHVLTGNFIAIIQNIRALKEKPNV